MPFNVREPGRAGELQVLVRMILAHRRSGRGLWRSTRREEECEENDPHHSLDAALAGAASAVSFDLSSRRSWEISS